MIYLDTQYSRQQNTLILTVVVPVYNGRRYIADCVNVLRSVQHPHEILLIDDGSTDDSLAYMHETFGEMTDCRILHKENGGIVSARNYGMAHAQGKYILFVDQDDRPVAATLDLAIQRCEESDCDMAYWSTMTDRDGKVVDCDRVLQDTVVERAVIREEIIPTYLPKLHNKFVTAMGHLWGALLCRDTILRNHLQFKRFVGYEDDYLFLLDYLMVAERICFIRDVGYYWVRYDVSTSAQQRHIADYWSKMTAMYSYVYETCHQHSITVPETMDLYVRQSLPLYALQNYASIRNRNKREEVREWLHYMQNTELSTAFDQPSVRNYAGRDRRIYVLLHHRLYTIAICYVYIDSLYHYLRASVGK